MPTLGRLAAYVVALGFPLMAACASTRGRAASPRDGSERSVEGLAVQIITPRVLRADRTVEASFRVNKDAYVAVFALDYDGRARMLFPASPIDSGLARADTVYQLPRFFAGQGTARFATYPGSANGAPLAQSGGLIYTVASDRPLQLRRLANTSGEWNELLLERLTWNVGYKGVASAVGGAVTSAKQDFQTSVSKFTAGPLNPAYGLASLMPRGCDAGASSPSGKTAPSAQTVTHVYVDGVQYARLTRTTECGGSTVTWLPSVPGRP